MAETDPKDSVQDEQFGKTEDTKENDNTDQKQEVSKEPVSDEAVNEPMLEEPKESPVSTDAPETASEEKVSESDTTSKTSDKEAIEENVSTSDSAIEPNDTVVAVEEESNSESTIETNDKEAVEEKSETVADEKPLYPEDVDYTVKTKEELLDLIKVYLSDFPISNIRKQVDAIKSCFYKLHNAEIEQKQKAFIEAGGKEEDFKIEESPIEITMKELLNEYRDKRNEQAKKIEGNKEENLKAKYDIIDAIKELINSQESLNKTFHDFRDLQDKWREIGPVPQAKVKDLWEKYHYHVEAFYDYIKINKELRDLDFKKNLDGKMKLCEKAEELLLEPSVVEAFKQLQLLHDQWREIGPVPSDKRTELWERFKETTSKINHKHQEYFVTLKEDQKKNLQEKTVLCEKAEVLIEQIPTSAKEWEAKSKALIDLQKIWKTIGFAPKKYNTKIYERFRAACDTFFNAKRDFFASNREEQENNLQLKIELCIQAEALADSTDWKKTTNELIKLQKKWKTIGSVHIKQSDKVWKRFRAACDKFFNRKSDYYANIDTTYQDNLTQKEELLKEIEAFKPGEDVASNINLLKDFQRKWSEIGFVPIKQKDAIQDKYRALINAKFDELKLDDEKKSIIKFRSKIEGMAEKPNSGQRISMERDKCYNKLKQLENDIALWENNIGFFSNSKNAESLISDVERKIALAKEKMQALNEKLNTLDEFDK